MIVVSGFLLKSTKFESEPNPLSNLNAPVTQTERITSLDVLRGFALLGILMVNIQSFGLIDAKYLTPPRWANCQERAIGLSGPRTCFLIRSSWRFFRCFSVPVLF